HPQLPERCMREETLAVRTRVEERLEGIGESDDLGELMNLLPLEPARIPLPARPFVLLKDNLRDPIGVGAHPSERLGAQLGVSFDEVPFLGGQRAWLVQDLLGDPAPSDLM